MKTLELYYFLIINIIAFIFMFIDKKKAINNQYRISEDTLILLAIIGGSFGILFGMNKFRHKTKKPKFKFGIPSIIIIQGLIFVNFIGLV